jgi:hypothetical protein
MRIKNRRTDSVPHPVVIVASVIFHGCRPPDQFQQLGGKADRHGSAQPGGIPRACRPLWLLVLGLRVEGVFLVGRHRRGHLLSFRYWAASAGEAS